MLRRFCTSGWGSLTTGEASAVADLCTSHRQLLADGSGFADLRSESGYAACAVFLTNLDKAARALHLDAAPREYRKEFSANYRALFPDSARHYRVDVLEASVDQHSAIWVNGEKFELSPEAIGHAEELQQAWSELGSTLDRWHDANVGTARPVDCGISGNVVPPRPTKSEISQALTALDASWARFEFQYISELITIEEKARSLIVNAVKYEIDLQNLPEGGPEHLEAERNLVRCIAHLNSVANFKRKGRDDLGCDILDSARDVLRRCKMRQNGGFTGAYREAAETLATDVVESFDAMRNYLRQVGECIERVDPHLCNNAGLVTRLVDWEESWEVGARYVRQTQLLEAVCDLVAEVKAAQVVAPELTAMVEDCDVELFLVLPRVVLLCFLADPSNKRAELVRSLLPHRFHKGREGEATMMLDPELSNLLAQFKGALRVLEGLLPPAGAAQSAVAPKDAAWEALVKRAVLGASAEAQGLFAASPEARKVGQDLMREVEGWSLELQRHCPEDWNQFSAVLVQCLTGSSPKEPDPEFQV